VELDKIPGYSEAIARADAEAEALRDFAFTDLPAEIAGLKVGQLTLRRLCRLMVDKSPFIIGGDYGPEHIVQFLWLVSLEYCDSLEVRDEFVKVVSLSMPLEETAKAIFLYRDRALMDRPIGSRRAVHSTPATSFMAVFIHEFASCYGWTEDHILDLPMARIYQLLRRMRIEKDPNSKFHCTLVDKVNAEYMQKAVELANE